MPTGSDFEDVRFGSTKATDRGEGRDGAAGDYGQAAQAPLNGDVPQDNYPNLRGYGYDPGNPQFSSDKADTPQAMADEASGQSATANDLIGFLNTSPYVMGSRVCHELDEKQTPAHPSGGQAGPGTGRTGPA